VYNEADPSLRDLVLIEEVGRQRFPTVLYVGYPKTLLFLNYIKLYYLSGFKTMLYLHAK
jgi:hypothetical protein